MINFVPLNTKSHYSLGIGLSKPDQIAQRLVECGYGCAALTDLGSVSGVVDFASALKNACSSCGHPEKTHSSVTKLCSIKGVACEGYKPAKLKPIFGTTQFLCKGDSADKSPENKLLSTVTLLAKNKIGWKSLIKIIGESNKKENYNDKPRLNIKEVAKLANKNLIAMSGAMGSDLSNILFLAPNAYRATSLDVVRSILKPTWEKEATELALQYQELFGKENFFLQIQLIDSANCPAYYAVAQCLRKIGNTLGIPCVATPSPFYASKDQAADQRILLCNELDSTLERAKLKIEATTHQIDMSVFFKSNNYHIPTLQEMVDAKHTPQELENSHLISEICEVYDIESRPLLPKFCDNSADRLFEEAVKGLKARDVSGVEYTKRLQKEVRVLNEAGLADYFLIVQDYVKWAKANDIPVGPGRGSTAGCLVAYLMEITEVDPLPPNLIFERFYNDGRNTKDKVSLPDIDMDFSKNGRKKVIEYIRQKYGERRVCGIATFNRLKGRGALKAVFSAYGKISFDQMNLITNLIPEPSKVAGELQESIDEFGEASIIEYAIENEKKIWDYCYYNENGELEGEFASEFAQAIRLEDTKTHMGMHAAGIIVSSHDLDEICPMVSNSKGTQLMCGWEMTAAEKAGLVKLDILGIAALDKLKAIQDLLSTGRMDPVELD